MTAPYSAIDPLRGFFRFGQASSFSTMSTTGAAVTCALRVVQYRIPTGVHLGGHAPDQSQKRLSVKTRSTFHPVVFSSPLPSSSLLSLARQSNMSLALSRPKMALLIASSFSRSSNSRRMIYLLCDISVGNGSSCATISIL